MRSVNLFLLIFFAVAACSEPRHVILGSEEHGWAGNKTEIILDAKIDKLEVRHVRMREQYGCNQCRLAVLSSH